MVGRIVPDFAERRRAPGAALIEDDDAPMGGIKKSPMHRRGTGPRAPMQKQDRLAVGIARFLPIHRVALVDLEPPGALRSHRRDTGDAPRPSWHARTVRAP